MVEKEKLALNPSEAERALDLVLPRVLALEIVNGRLGLRQMALHAIPQRRYKKLLILAEGATRLPLEVVGNLVLEGRVPRWAEVEAKAREAEEALRQVAGAVPRPAANPFLAERQRPWRALAVALEVDPSPSRRDAALRQLLSLDEVGAWLAFSYLRLAMRRGESPERIHLGLQALIVFWKTRIAPHRERWFPYLEVRREPLLVATRMKR